MRRRKDYVNKKFRRGPTHPRVAHSCLSTLGSSSSSSSSFAGGRAEQAARTPAGGTSQLRLDADEPGTDSAETGQVLLDSARADPDDSLAEAAHLLAGLDSSQATQIHATLPLDETLHQDANRQDNNTLPHHSPAATGAFTLGTMDSQTTAATINAAYEEAVHFRPNTFNVPHGSSGKAFVAQLSVYLQGFGDSGPFEGQALRIAMVFQQLLLQKTRPPSQSLAKCLQTRLHQWNNGEIDQLRHECRTIQQLLQSQSSTTAQSTDARHFANLVTGGKLTSAIHMLQEGGRGGVLELDDRVGDSTVRDVLKSKHPIGQPANPDALIPGQAPIPPHPVQFEALNRASIRRAALHTQGGAGPSGVNADTWRHMCTGFSDASDQLCDAMAQCARRLATTYVDPTALEAYTSCRLIPLDKSPGVRPIGIGEVLRRILGKAILSVIRPEIMEAAGSLQLCAGQDGGIEAAIHAMGTVFDDPSTECLLLADASNAFNCLNREVCLRNVQHACPSLAHLVVNTYRWPAKLFVGGETILSEEGTTQGDPVAMAMYAIGIAPLMKSVATEGAVQSWYADDAGSGGKLLRVRKWWDRLVGKGPQYGYFPNPSKSILVVKPQFLDEAIRIFDGTGVTIQPDGARYLGAAIGTPAFVTSYLQQKVEEWSTQVHRLSQYAITEPQAAYSAYVYGLQSKWTFLCRAQPGMAEHLAPLDAAITNTFIPALLGRPVNAEERTLIALPCRFGGLGIPHPSSRAEQHQSSLDITASLTCRVLAQDPVLGTAIHDVRAAKKRVMATAGESIRAAAQAFSSSASSELQRVIALASEPGASSWLTCRPLQRHGFTLTKSEFRDAVCLRFNWLPVRLPSLCACGQQFTVSHSLSCPTGGFPSIRHNKVRDLTARLLRRVAHQVAVEPHLQPLSGEQLRYRTAIADDQARLDVVASGIWGGRFERTYIDVRVFNPHASSNRSNSLAATYVRHEKAKRRAYEQRLREVEHSSFVPAIFSTTGGMGKHGASLYKRIASLLAAKTGEPYSITLAAIRCQIGFALVRSALMCLRGARKAFLPAMASDSAALVVAEARISA